MVSYTSNIPKRISRTLLLILVSISIIHFNCDQDNDPIISEPEPPPMPVVLVLIDYQAAWSPDGQRIVYSDTRLNNRLLWIMNKDGSGKKQLTY